MLTAAGKTNKMDEMLADIAAEIAACPVEASTMGPAPGPATMFDLIADLQEEWRRERVGRWRSGELLREALKDGLDDA